MVGAPLGFTLIHGCLWLRFTTGCYAGGVPRCYYGYWTLLLLAHDLPVPDLDYRLVAVTLFTVDFTGYTFPTTGGCTVG